MDDNTQIFKKEQSQPQPQAQPTSVRGWIALILSVGLFIVVLLIVVAPFFKIEIPKDLSSTVITLFATGFTAAITHYFQSKEGQK